MSDEALSRWFEVDQTRIDAFAAATDDAQFIHTDPIRAAQTAFGGTIAHGFLTLSLLSAMYIDALPTQPGVAHSINYGFDKLRFMAPVPAGSHLRGAFRLINTETRVPGQISNTWAVRVEIKGGAKPALMARWLTRQYLVENPAGDGA